MKGVRKMKVKITQDTKKCFYMSETHCIETVEEALKKSNGVTKDELETLANFICKPGSIAKVYESSAEYCKNIRIFDRYGEGSEHADVWVNAIIYDGWKHFYKAGAYLSDIWEITGHSDEHLKAHMFIRDFAEV